MAETTKQIASLSTTTKLKKNCYVFSTKWLILGVVKKKTGSVTKDRNTAALLFVNIIVTNTSKQYFPNYFLSQSQGLHTFPSFNLQIKRYLLQ
jgi:hypothetical protein